MNVFIDFLSVFKWTFWQYLKKNSNNVVKKFL